MRRVLHAQTQEDADEAVAQLWEESLEWYAPEERELLVRVLESMNEKVQLSTGIAVKTVSYAWLGSSDRQR